METPITKKYVITNDIKTQFITLVLINEIINYQKYFPVYLQDEDVFLMDYLEYMKEHNLLEVKDEKYIPTTKGRECLEKFYAKYFEFLKVFDIYCAVDLEKGEFAFAKMFDNMDEKTWNTFLAEKRFSDVRVAVAEFKGINPMEIVFMSFLNEGKFETNILGWQHNLTMDIVWNDIVEICNSAITLEYLKKDDVIQDIIKQGSELMLDLIKQEEELKNQPEEFLQEETIVEEIVEETVVEEYVEIVEPPYYDYAYYQPYYDPFYISPIWLVPFIL